MEKKYSFIVCMILVMTLPLGCGGGGSDSGGFGSGSSSDEGLGTGWSIPESQVVDGGPGKDGIPALTDPAFSATAPEGLTADSLVLGININGEARAYPHFILDYHEIVNDTFGSEKVVLSYCPLTGSGLLWKGKMEHANQTFGVSGLLYNSNLILYDRSTDSYWAQMLAESVQGTRLGEVPESLQVIETTWQTWKIMYPDTVVMTRNTGFSRNYNTYPYGDYRANDSILFDVSNLDNRLSPKERVVGIRDGGLTKVYQIASFGPGIHIINDEFNDTAVVVAGSSDNNFAVIYKSTTNDNVIHTFTPLENVLPNIMQDEEGNVWDIFGNAVSGSRQGEQLEKVDSYIAYWFAWGAFFLNAEIYF